MHDGRQREHLKRLFERALRIEGVTAWIMVNDVSASYALDFLTNRGILVPRSLSIISFDDQPQALEKGVTSFNFNYAATMQAILRFIADPRLFLSRKPVVEIEGEIIPRRTTGAVQLGEESARKATL